MSSKFTMWRRINKRQQRRWRDVCRVTLRVWIGWVLFYRSVIHSLKLTLRANRGEKYVKQRKSYQNSSQTHESNRKRGITWPQGRVFLSSPPPHLLTPTRSCTCFFFALAFNLSSALFFRLSPSHSPRLFFRGTMLSPSLLIIRHEPAFSGAWILWAILPPPSTHCKQISKDLRTEQSPLCCKHFFPSTDKLG